MSPRVVSMKTIPGLHGLRDKQMRDKKAKMGVATEEMRDRNTK